MKKIYFKGYYGFKNIGDDIFCVAADWISNEIWEDSQAVFIGENLPIVSDNAKVYHFDNHLIKRMFELYTLFVMDKIIYFGGSLLHSKIEGLFDIKYYLNKFSTLNQKLGTIGTSIGPFKTEEDKESMELFLNKFQFISVRDYSSVELLEEMNVSAPFHFSFDLAILVDNIFPELKQERKTNIEGIRVGVSLCHYERYVNGNLANEKEREKAVEVALEGLIESNTNISEVVFFIFHGGENNGDGEITNSFYEKFKNKINVQIVNYTTDTKDFLTEFVSCDLIFGMRLHSGMLAYSLDIPFLLVEYHEKSRAFLDTIQYYNRFDVNDSNQNIKLLNSMVNSIVNREDQVYGSEKMIEPSYFKNIMIEELKKIKI